MRPALLHTVGSRVNACLEHLYLAFENNCEKVNIDSLDPYCCGWQVAVWLIGNIVGRINEVTLRRAGLVLRWVIIRGYIYRLGI